MADKINIIVAHSKNFVIGKNGAMPWNNPYEMAYFKKMTMGHTVIMGRKTWESLGGPLPGRVNIVVTSSSIEGVKTANSLERALEMTQGQAWVIGGQQLYEAALPFADLVYASQMFRQGDIEGDRYFPDLSKPAYKDWMLVQNQMHQSEGIETTFIVSQWWNRGKAVRQKTADKLAHVE